MLNAAFLRELNASYDKRSDLVRTISDLLNIDENSVYRRLRGTVRFSADEIGVLAYRLGISLDKVLGEFPEGEYKAWKIDFPLIFSERGFDLDVMRKNLPVMEKFVENPDTEMGGAIGSLTRHFFMHYKEISRFMLLKWDHYYKEVGTFGSFRDIQIEPPIMELFNNHLLQYRKVKHVFFIWDSLIFTKLVNDIQYFRSMSLLTEEDILLIKQDLFQLLNDCETAAAEGMFGDTGNTFDLYISPINIDTSQTYMRSGEEWYYSVEVHVIMTFQTTKPQTSAHLHRSIVKLKNASVLISRSAEKERRTFFNRQRDIVGAL